MTETVMDAVNAALGVSAGDGNANEPELENQNAGADGAGDAVDSLEAGDDQNAVGHSEADDKGGEPGEEAAGDDQPEGEGGEAGKLERDPITGKFVKPAEKAAADAKLKEGKEGDGDKAAAKKPDPVNDPIPKDLKQPVQDRIRTLVKTTKDLTTERDTIKRDFDYMIEGVRATGTTPEQYGEVLSFMALFNSNDPKQQEQALELLEGVADRLATLIGKERKVGDALSEHPDLREAVAKGQVTAQYAKEIARTRNQAKFRTDLSTAATEKQNAETRAAQELSTARNDLNELEASLKASDPLYEQKKAQIVPILQPIFKAIPPSQWKAKFQEAYKAARVAAPQRRTVPQNQPMRAGRGAGGGAATGAGSGNGMVTPTGSALDALNAGLAAVGRR